MYANGQFYTLRDAYRQTQFPISKYVFQSFWKTRMAAQFVRFATITDGSATLDYRRRAYGDFIKLNWSLPGQAISPGKLPQFVEARSQLRPAYHDVQIPSYLRNNYSNAGFMAQGGGPFRPGPDPLWTMVWNTLRDLAEGAWDTMFSGKYIDTVAFADGGALTAAFIDGAITPGPHNDPGRGNGSLRFVKASNKASFRAPGDADYGPDVTVQVGGTYTLRSGNTDARITFKVAALPASDAHSDLLFSSTTQSPDGLISLMEPSQILDLATPTAVDFKHLDYLPTKLGNPYRNAKPGTVYVMRNVTFNALKSLARSLGGTTLETKSFGSMVTQVPPGMEPWGLVELPTYNGYPILIDDSLPARGVDGVETYPILMVCLDPNITEGGGTDHGAFIGAVRGPANGPVTMAYGMGWEIAFLGRDQHSANELARITLELCWGLGSSYAATMITGFYDPIM